MDSAEPVDLVEMYRDLMARLDTASQPQRALDRGFYVPRLNFSTRELAARLLLEPTSTHFLVGGIGSGKTTELLNMRPLIERGRGTKVLYIDVSQHQRLEELAPGVLTLLAGLALYAQLNRDQKVGLDDSYRLLLDFASGAWSPDSGPDDEVINGYEWNPGLLKPPGPEDYAVKTLGSLVERLRIAVQDTIPHIVVVFDALDRIHDRKKLAELVREDVAALKQAGVGVVLVGPLYVLFWEERSLLECFDQYSYLPDVDVEIDTQGRDFLHKVLRARVPKERISDEICMKLVMLSGGILRDLLKLTKGAVQRAFMADSPQVDGQHVRAAAEVEGRRLLLGVPQDSLSKLQALAQGKGFVLATREDLLLLEHRRVIQHQGSDGQVRYTLHPTLRLLLRPDGSWQAVQQ